jgi:hypothetical protein
MKAEYQCANVYVELADGKVIECFVYKRLKTHAKYGLAMFLTHEQVVMEAVRHVKTSNIVNITVVHAE